MPYQNNIPLATDRLNDSQAAILGNFQQLAVDFAVNHSGYGTPNAGKHDRVVFPNLAAQPVVAFTPTELGMYNFTNPITGVPEIYVRRAAALAGYPITASQYNVVPNRGWTYLASGLVLKFGTSTFTGTNAPAGTNLNAIGPAFTQVPYVTLAMDGASVNTVAVSFRVEAPSIPPLLQRLTLYVPLLIGTPRTVNWMAIGPV